MTTIETIAISAGSICVGAYLMYLRMKIAILEKEIKNFPTPQELANEILRIKLPIADLPPDIQANIMAGARGPIGFPAKPGKIDKGDSSYIG